MFKIPTESDSIQFPKFRNQKRFSKQKKLNAPITILVLFTLRDVGVKALGLFQNNLF